MAEITKKIVEIDKKDNEKVEAKSNSANTK